MIRLSTTILWISPVISLLLMLLILSENFSQISTTFDAAGQPASLLPSRSTHPMPYQLLSVSQSTPNGNSTQIVDNISTTTDNNSISAIEVPDDEFGITEIYPTKDGGREWFLNMSYPTNSSNFSMTNFSMTNNLPQPTKLPDGSWRINATHIRMVVNTSANQEDWKNIEITGYVRLSHLNNYNEGSSPDNNKELELNDGEELEVNGLVFVTRSGRHSSEVPCEGTAYNGAFNTDGSVGWKKEIWHTGGYTDERARYKIAESFLNQWIGWKVVVYNIENGNETSAVKLESYIDSSNNNNWTKVSEFIDNGGWYSKSNILDFFNAGCDRARDYVITEGAPFLVFRTDNLLLDFKDFSIREIQPPLNTTQSTILKFE